jgi:hypothetical protein
MSYRAMEMDLKLRRHGLLGEEEDQDTEDVDQFKENWEDEEESYPEHDPMVISENEGDEELESGVTYGQYSRMLISEDEGVVGEEWEEDGDFEAIPATTRRRKLSEDDLEMLHARFGPQRISVDEDMEDDSDVEAYGAKSGSRQVYEDEDVVEGYRKDSLGSHPNASDDIQHTSHGKTSKVSFIHPLLIVLSPKMKSYPFRQLQHHMDAVRRFLDIEAEADSGEDSDGDDSALGD